MEIDGELSIFETHHTGRGFSVERMTDVAFTDNAVGSIAILYDGKHGMMWVKSLLC